MLKELKNIHHAVFAFCCLIGMLLVSCSQNGRVEEEWDDVDNQTGTYISVSLSTLARSVNSRSNPNGGEDGDGHEVGINNENNINNLTLFLFDSASSDVLNSAENPILTTFFFNNINFKGTESNDYTYKSYPIFLGNLIINPNTHMLAIANA